MWQELALLHRDSKSDLPALPGAGALWRTCLRELRFLEPGSAAPCELPAGTQLRSGTEAHRVLVEICSGLESPLFGETEVFGQFREFRESMNLPAQWLALFDSVEEDVKKLRRRFLTGLGSQSYGSLARRHLPEGGELVIVGAGRLVRDLLPWLEGRPLTIAARRPEIALPWLPTGARALPLAALTQAVPGLASASWLVAAPVANEQLLGFWKHNPAGLVLDFRGDQRFLETPDGSDSYLGLRALYQELEAVKQLHERRRREALAFAAELSRRHEAAVLHRPFGWEDAFA